MHKNAMILNCPTPLMKLIYKQAQKMRQPYRNPPWMAKSEVSQLIKKQSNIRKRKQTSQLKHAANKTVQQTSSPLKKILYRMNTRRHILRNLTTLAKFEPMSPRKIYYINCFTRYDILGELINLVKQKMEFVLETKYDKINGCPKLIQVLFVHKLVLHIILVETLYLPELDFCLHHQIRCLFSVILLPSNEIQSWNDIKSDLRYFLNCSLFTRCQIEKLQVTNIKQKFEAWFEEKFIDIRLSAPSDGWMLEEAVGFLFRQYFDTTLSHSRDWNIGLFAHFNTECDPKYVGLSPDVICLLKNNKRRSVLCQHVIHECIAVRKITAVLQNNCTRKHAENHLIKYYGKFK
ncbi:unnamed protein product [Adineta ricciae]|uniref:Uncharacterized protein n=1 Tax=Adineta ricciae TaxID=249248 RepID=A0A814BMI7_ADIRI|nr:unnamed protein product [Adineta ricciae]CAF1498066.1 unnamed protein product [Adineta ricciae]